MPFDVHKFLIPIDPIDGGGGGGGGGGGDSGGGGRAWRAAATLHCAEALADSSDAPVVLHYSNCGFSNWVRKYEILGDFHDAWWGRVPIRIPSHLASRDAVSRGGSAREREAYYRRAIMGNELGEARLLAAAGLLVRIDLPSEVVRRARRRLRKKVNF